MRLKVKPKPPSPKMSLKPVLMSALLAFVVVIVGIGFFIYNASGPNYAEESAKPLEKALITKGATKDCSRGDNGRGWDNKAPWYYAIFEVPGNKEAATSLTLATMKGEGFHTFEGRAPSASPNEVNTYSDSSSQKSNYKDLKDRNIGLTVEIMADSTYEKTDNQFCGVKKNANTPTTGKTLVRLTLGLPEYK